jgi:glycosyltransferase involved in cell wall biosynthesis
MNRDRPTHIGILLQGNESYGVLSVLKSILVSVDRRQFRFFGLFLAPGQSRLELEAMFDEVCNLDVGPRRELTGKRLGSRLSTGLRELRWYGKSIARTAGAIRRLKLDVMHVHNYNLGLVGGVASRWTRIPCLWHWHVPAVYPGWHGWLFRSSLTHLVHTVACVSRHTLESLPPEGRRKAVVIYNGLDVEFIRSHQTPGGLRSRLNIPPQAPIIVTVGRLTPWKGHQVLLRGVAPVLAEFPQARFVIVGSEVDVHPDGCYFDKLRSMALEEGISDSVIFTGEWPNVVEYLCDCTIACMPSFPWEPGMGEGFGLTTVEAMAAGVPAIATRCAASPEIVDHGVTGLLVPPKDSQSIADAILCLLRDEPLRMRLGRAGQAAAASRFNLTQMAQALERLYQSCTRDC